MCQKPAVINECSTKYYNYYRKNIPKKMAKFVDEWNIIQTLGEGAYGEVQLLVHQKTNEAVAMKVVDLRKCKDATECVLKEEKIHRHMHHENIIRLLGKREELNTVYIFLEYAAGGELFNKIEPDVGMPVYEAQNYMKQLLSGVSYLHNKGVAHRDIKPENLLLDESGNLKISDFGMATIFRLRGKERLLDKKCGTLPYVAPEVLVKPYNAQPADLWSCGIVFVAMLAGELPWDQPRDNCEEYIRWKKDNCLLQTPWSKLSTTAYSLARKILACEPSNRPKVDQILNHPWMTVQFTDFDGDETDSSEVVHKMKQHKSNEVAAELPTVALSQPTLRPESLAPANLAALLQNREHMYFSQPTQNEDLIVNSQMLYSQSPLTQNNFKRLIKRMTRFFVKTSCEKTISVLCKLLDNLNLVWNSDHTGAVTISTFDIRKMQLVFKANIIEMDGKLLLDFRLSKGCGLEFKRRFIKIKNALSDIILHT